MGRAAGARKIGIHTMTDTTDRQDTRHNINKRILAIWIAVAALLPSAVAQEVLLQEGQTKPSTGTFTVPFVFYSDAFGPSVGFSVGNRGWVQPQASAFATVIGSAYGSVYGFIVLRDIEIPWTDRLFIDSQLNLGQFNQLDIYSDGNPSYPNKRAGSNDSDAEDYLTGDGTDTKLWTLFKYVLPIGSGDVDPKSTLVLHEGLVVEGARDTSVWNPLENGYTLVGVKPFFRRQDVQTDEAGDQKVTTSGAEFLLRYENTDFHENPSSGSSQQLRYTRDWGWMGSSEPWETVDMSLSKYISFGAGKTSRQRVLALNAWWIDTPSWNDDGHRPPSFAGATLGGTDRMQGYSEGRFNDRSAVYYAAEYRYIPDWNPLKGIAFLNNRNAHVQWLQFVAGAEVGRVAEDFDLSKLHGNMKTTGLFGIRAMVNTLVVRADVGITAEGGAVQMTIDQPF